MKKLLVMLVMMVSLQSQSQFFEGFEGDVFPPPGWITANSGSGTQPWRLNFPNFPAYEGSHCAFLDRFNTPQSTAGYWLITPAISVTANTPLTFLSRQTIIGADGTTIYQVRISTTSQTDLNSFAVLDSWSETDLNTPALEYEQKIVPLDAYVGQTVYLAFFRLTAQSGFQLSGDRWLIDNVTVRPTNVVQGSIQYSANGNCATDSMSQFVNIPIDIQSGSTMDRVFSSTSGSFSYTTLNNSFTLTPHASIGSYFTITPTSYSYNFASLGNSQTTNFCITPHGIHPDLEVTLLPVRNLSPGFTAAYTIVYKNKGNQLQSGTVTFHFDDTKLDYLASNPANDGQSTGTLSWNFVDLKPFESRTIQNIQLNLHTPTDTPAVNIGDVLLSTVDISSSQPDETPEDNTYSLSQVVAASHDPNDKTILEGNTIDIAKIDNHLNYVIRFQNVGTADATKVVVRDILSENLNPTTFEMVASSHVCHSSLTNGNKLEFIFDNINLPPVSVDETESQGYIAFKIKPALTVGLGSVIENTASIYFDFNFPIVTNTTSTTFITLANSGFEQKNHWALYPNPVRQLLHVNFKQASSIESVRIYNVLGQEIMKLPELQIYPSVPIDVSALSVGSYLLEIETSRGKSIQKFIKI